MLRLCFIILFLVSFFLPGFAQTIPTNGLVAWYPFNGNANDLSGNALNGIVNGATLTSDRFGNPNSAYDFDGINDFIQVAHNALVNFGPNDDFTISVWVQPQTQLGSGNVVDIIGKWEDFPGGSNPSYPFAIRMRRTPPIGTLQMLRFDQPCSNFPVLLSNNSIIDNNWHSLIYVKDGLSLTMYIDGVLINQVTDNTSCGTGNSLPMYIGKRGGTLNPSHYRGKIDDIAIYNRALSDCEIQELLDIDINTDLVAYYPFNGNTLDVSGNNNNGVNNGASLTQDRNGNPNSAYNFDGANDYIFLGNILNPNLQNGMTISAWFNPLQPQGIINRYVGIQLGRKTTGDLGLRMRTENDDKFDANFNPGTSTPQAGNGSFAISNTLNYNLWVHLTGTYQNGVVRLYANGNFVSENSVINGTGGQFSYLQAGAEFNIGRSYSDGNAQRFFRGKIDEVKIYSRVLTDCEIKQLHDPSITLTAKDTSVFACIDETISLQNSLQNIQWFENGSLIGTGSTINYTVLNSSVIISEGINGCGCTQADTFRVQLKAQPNYNLQDTFSICPNVFDTLPFSFNSGGTISWSDGSLFVDSTALNPIIKPIPNFSNNSVFQTIYTRITNQSSGCEVLDSAILEVTSKPSYTWGSDSFFVCHNDTNNSPLWTAANPNQFSQIGYVSYGDTSFLPPGVTSPLFFQGENFDTIDRVEYFRILIEDINGCRFTDSVFTLTYARFFAEAGMDTFVCAGVEVQIGEPNDSAYIYSWTPTYLMSSPNTSFTNVSAPIDTTGILTAHFHLKKTDTITGCEERDSVWVWFNRYFDIEAGDDTIMCSQDIISLGENAKSGFSYQWLGSDSISNLTISNPDFSYLNPDTASQTLNLIVEIIEDSTQCKNSDTVEITVKPQIYVNAGSDIDICGSDTVPIGFNNNQAYSYTWNSTNGLFNSLIDSTVFSLDNFTDTLKSFEYFLKATFDGCEESDSILIDVRPKPFDDLSGPNIVCPGVDSAEYFVGRPFTNYSYSWFIDGGNISVNNNDSVIVAWDSTNFNAFVGHYPTNPFGCVGDTFIWNVRINPLLIPEIDVDTLRYCERDKNVQDYNILYPIVNSNYTWFVEGGQILNGQGTDQVSVAWDSLGFGQIWVAEENITNIDSCFGTSDTLNIEVLPDPVLDSIRGPIDLCDFGDTLDYTTLSTLTGITYWFSDSVSQIVGSNQGDTIQITTTADGDFTITSYSLSSEGCYSDTISQQVNVRYFQIPEIEIDTGKICFWDSTDFTFRIKDRYDSSDYQWTSNHGQIVQGQGDSEMTLRVYQPDTVQIYVTELNNAVEDTCYGISDTIEIYFYPRPERNLNISGPDTLCFSQDCAWYKYPGWDNSSFYWSTNAGVCNTMVSYDSIELGFPNTGNYYLSVVETSEYDCVGDTVECVMEVFPNPQTSISFNDSIICPSDKLNRIYQADGFDFSEFSWDIKGGIINFGQGSDIISVNWEDTADLYLSVFETSFADCSNDTIEFPIYTDNMRADLFVLGYDSTFSDFTLRGNSNSVDFNENQELYLLAGESIPEYLSKTIIENGEEVFILDSIFGSNVYYYQYSGVNACGDTLYSKTHNNILLKANAEEELNYFEFEWNPYEAWNGDVVYQLYEFLNKDNSVLIEETSENQYEFENADKFFEHCFYVLAENTEQPELISRSNLVCLEFLRKLKLPDVVTANGDGYNDKFVIENIHLYPEHRLEIYNRSGRPVFNSDNYQNDWPSVDLASGVYYYQFKVKGNYKEEFGGYIHLMR
ncbi:MAG: LamG-like jellyroll fold domain-containing protein [Cytophagales bacterium]